MTTSVPTRWLLAVLGLILIFYAILFTSFYDLEQVAADSDAKEYVTLGQNIFSSHEFSRQPGRGEPEVFRTPGYPFLVGLVLKIFNSLTVLVWLQVGLVILSIFLICLIGAAWGYPKVGLIAGLGYALDPTTIANTSLALSEITFVALFLASLYLLVFRLKFSHLSLGLGSGLLGVSILVRPVGLYILPLVLLLTLFFRFKEIKGKFFPTLLAVIIGLLVTVGPWLGRNQVLTHEAKLSSVGEYNLLFYNAALFKAQQNKLDHQTVQDEYRRLFTGASTYDYQSFEFSQQYKKLAQEEILSAPLSYLTYHLLKTAPFFISSGFDNYRYLVSKQTVVDVNLSDLLLKREWSKFIDAVWAEPLGLIERVGWLLVLILAVSSLLIKKNRPLALSALVLIGWVALLTGPVAMPRYHLPVSPFLLLLAGLTVSELLEYLKTVKNKVKYA